MPGRGRPTKKKAGEGGRGRPPASSPAVPSHERVRKHRGQPSLADVPDMRGRGGSSDAAAAAALQAGPGRPPLGELAMDREELLERKRVTMKGLRHREKIRKIRRKSVSCRRDRGTQRPAEASESDSSDDQESDDQESDKENRG